MKPRDHHYTLVHVPCEYCGKPVFRHDVYTVGQSTLTLGSRLTTTHLPEGWEWAR